MFILRIVNAVKQFKDTLALNDVSLEIPKGKIFGLLGPNGAGKTTLIRMITQITKPDSGEIFFNEKPIGLLDAEKIGYLPEERGLYKNMMLEEQLIYLGLLKGLSKKEVKEQINYWFEKFNIQDWKKKKINELSKGMQQKAQFISTLLHKPELIIFDEPFTGLDPINTEIIKNEIINLKNNGVSIIFSTHRMEQIEEICEEIALINKGEIIINGEMKEIKLKYKKNNFKVGFSKEEEIEESSLFSIISKYETGAIIHSNTDNTNELLKELMKKGEVVRFEEVLPSLNEIFIDAVKGVSHE